MAIKEVTYCGNNFIISYNMIQNQMKQNMVFLHGWGSNKELMALAFAKSFTQYNHIYIDLPGFGSSTNECVLSTHDYAQIIELFLQDFTKHNTTRPPVIVGHSFGGKIALLLKYEIILLSSAGILLEKPLFVRIKIKFAKILKLFKIRLNFLKAEDAKNLSPVMYEVFKGVVNEDFCMHYKNFSNKVSIFWGRDDNATPLEAYKIICQLMPHAITHVLDGDHYFFLKQADLIERLYYENALDKQER